MRFHDQLSLLIFARLIGVLHELIHRRLVLHEQLRTRLAHVRVEPREGLRVLTVGGELIINFLDATLFDFLSVGQLLEGDSLGEEFVEVEVIVPEEFQATRLNSLVRNCVKITWN